MKLLESISYSNDTSCKLDLYLPEIDEFPLVVFFHGGGLESGSRSSLHDVFCELSKNGIAVATADYRMYPSASYPEFIEDAAMAVKWVSDNICNYGICRNIYISGSSAGAYLAMMLCFDKSYLTKHKIDSNSISGYIFDSAQPTTHFNVLRERGIDSKKIVIDSAAPIYHICENPNAPNMLILVSDNDMPNRLEQTRFFCEALAYFNYPSKRVHFKLMKGFRHTEYCKALNEHGENIFAQLIINFVKNGALL